MEIVLNFEEREIAVNEKCNFLELNKKLKKLLGSDLPKWDIVGNEVKWLHQFWPTIPYHEPWQPIIYGTATTNNYTITYGDNVLTESIVGFSDNADDAETQG